MDFFDDFTIDAETARKYFSVLTEELFAGLWQRLYIILEMFRDAGHTSQIRISASPVTALLITVDSAALVSGRKEQSSHFGACGNVCLSLHLRSR